METKLLHILDELEKGSLTMVERKIMELVTTYDELIQLRDYIIEVVGIESENSKNIRKIYELLTEKIK